MTLRNWISKTLIAAFIATGISLSAKPVKAETDFGQVGMFVARMLENHHFSRKEFNDELSKEFLKAYLRFLDFNHQYFTQEDVDGFVEKYATKLDDHVLDKKIDPAEEIYNLYVTRVTERVEKIKKLLDTEKFTFDSDRTVEISRENSDWPANEEAADKFCFNIRLCKSAKPICNDSRLVATN